jgi:thioredoxin-related protein
MWRAAERRVRYARAIVFAVSLTLASGLAHADWPLPPQGYIYKEAEGCPAPGQTYKPCVDHMAAFKDAIARAAQSDRKLLIVFGADWCPWCKALDKSLPSADVLDHADLKGKVELLKVATSAIINGKRVKVTSGQEVFDLILETSTGDLPAGIPSFALVDPKRPGRAIVRESVPVEDNSNGRDHDRAKLRALLASTLTELSQR